MQRPIASKLTYSNVMATLAVCAAAGGGYAVAATSSGGATTLTAGKRGLSQNFSTVLSIPKMGKVQAACPPGVAGAEVRFISTTTSTLYGDAYDDDDGNLSENGPLTDGDSVGSHFHEPVSTVHLNIFKATNDGTPNVSIDATHKYGNTDCANQAISVQALLSK